MSGRTEASQMFRLVCISYWLVGLPTSNPPVLSEADARGCTLSSPLPSSVLLQHDPAASAATLPPPALCLSVTAAILPPALLSVLLPLDTFLKKFKFYH